MGHVTSLDQHLYRSDRNRWPGGSSENKEVGRVHVAVIAEDYFLVRRMDFGDNDRLDNKRSFASFALRLALEAIDRLDDGSKKETSLSNDPAGVKTEEDPGSQSVGYGRVGRGFHGVLRRKLSLNP